MFGSSGVPALAILQVVEGGGELCVSAGKRYRQMVLFPCLILWAIARSASLKLLSGGRNGVYNEV